MKICAVQIGSEKGNVIANRDRHLYFIQKAIALGCDAIFFPELSLTGYHASLADSLATDGSDSRLAPFQAVSDEYKVLIGIGIPTQSANGVQVSMLLFRPYQKPLTYSKQYLHGSEAAIFTPGREMILLPIGNQLIAPAICYESIVMEHTEKASGLGATLYLASVANSKKGVMEAIEHYAAISMKFGMPVLMVNAVGLADSFECAGGTAAWSKDGALLGQLGAEEEGLLVFDACTHLATTYTINHEQDRKISFADTSMQISHSNPSDLPRILRLYEEATTLQKQKFSIHWPLFDPGMIQAEIAEKRQWKGMLDGEICCIWATTFSDPLIWKEANKDAALYIHRIATAPSYRGRGLVHQLVHWSRQFATENQKNISGWIRLGITKG